ATPIRLLSVHTTRQNRTAASPSIASWNTRGTPKAVLTLKPAPRDDRSWTVQGSSEAPNLMTPRMRAATRASRRRSSIGGSRLAVCSGEIGHAAFSSGFVGRQHVGTRLLAGVADERRALHGADDRMLGYGGVNHLGPALGANGCVCHRSLNLTG